MSNALRPLKLKFTQFVDKSINFGEQERKGVFKAGKLFAKVFNELERTSEGDINEPFSSTEQALAHAAFYSALRDEGVFHPKTFFILSSDEKGKPTIVAVMPKLAPIGKGSKLPKVGSAIERIVVRKLGVRALLDADPHISSHGDTTAPQNYGLGEDGRVYYHDLHVLNQTPHPLVMKWYEKKTASEKK